MKGCDFEPIPREHLGSLFHCVLDLFSLRLNDELIEMLILMVQQLRKAEIFTEFCIFKEENSTSINKKWCVLCVYKKQREKGGILPMFLNIIKDSLPWSFLNVIPIK